VPFVTLTFWQVADGLPTHRVRRQIVEQSQMHFRLGKTVGKLKEKLWKIAGDIGVAMRMRV